MTWTQQWITKPCSDEGWLHPGDGKLHCEFNQQEAETGRSSSSKPNAQNLPQDEEVRSSFVADPPNENIRISCCCDAETTNPTGGTFYCDKCGTACDTKPEEYVIVTADMSGAELRIIAELADDDIWIGAFARGEDVHSVGTEIMYAELWPTLTIKSILKPDGWTLADCKSEKVPLTNPNGTPILDKDGKQKIGSPCAYFAKKENGEPARQKCKCPGHNTYRNDNKSTNFLLAYGGGPTTLAARIKKKLDEAKEIMALHAQKFPKIWLYLENSGKKAKMMKKAFDMFNRRRLFPTPTWERATYKAKDDREKQLRFTDAIVEKNIADYIALKGDKPKGKLKEIDSEYWNLTHRKPTDKEIANAFKAMHGSIERQGKNHCIQGTNATIAKLAMGCGSCKGGKQFLWHTFEQYKARLIKFVHDELVVQCPKRHAKDVAALIGDAFKRAAAEKMKKVVMEFDFNIASYWRK
jgi:DNA polymerase I-like protein with 3'-5' exonuclease and polymerase domains